MRRAPLLRVALLALVLAPTAAAAQGTPEGEEGAAAASGTDLGRLRRAIAERRERVAAYERREEGLFEAIEAIDRAARAIEGEARRAAREAEEAEATRRRLLAEREVLEARLAKTRAALAERAVALYKAGALGPVPVLFAPGSLRERLSRLQGLRHLVDHDERLLARHEAERRALEEAVAATAAAEARREEARARRAERLAELERERRARRELLIQVRQDRARERALLNELEAAARELERTLRDLGASPAPAPDGAPFAARQGRLDAPVAGPVLRRFGRVVDAEYRTETFRKGVDFAVQRGEPV
ncbi:MAG: hypothetical protein R3263_09450, partial [Myxococcota bacterium]|nr:hypothetical protein [Myxococcota bacterium]